MESSPEIAHTTGAHQHYRHGLSTPLYCLFIAQHSQKHKKARLVTMVEARVLMLACVRREDVLQSWGRSQEMRLLLLCG